MKLVKNIAVVATLASVFAFASCGTTEAAKEAATTAEATVVEAAVEEATVAVEATAEAAVQAVESAVSE